MSRRHRCRHVTGRLVSMATLRQFLSLALVLSMVTAALVLNILSARGGWNQHVSPWDQAWNPQTSHKGPMTSSVPSADNCGEGGRHQNFTAEDLGLADVDYVNKRKISQHTYSPDPETEVKIIALLKSRNSCQRNEKSGVACLPYYYVAGFPKCGTSDFFLRLTSHPDIVRDPHNRKELNWVTRGRFRFSSGRTNALKSYKELFGKMLLHSQNSAHNLSRVIIGDHSSGTLWDNSHWGLMPANAGCSGPVATTADVINHLNPRARVLVLLREPAQRLYSEHLVFHRNSTKHTFHRMAVNAVREATACFQKRGVRACALGALHHLVPPVHLGLYHVYIADWLKLFPRDQIHLIRLEDMAENPQEVLRKAFAFLGVEPLQPEQQRRTASMAVSRAGSRRGSEGPMMPDTWRLLQQFYHRHTNRHTDILTDRHTDILID